MNLIFAGFLGLFAGVLVNYLSDVLPAQRRLAQPVCQKCSANYTWKDYFLMTACSVCGKPRSLRTYITLVAGVCLSLAIWTNPPTRGMGYWLGLIVMMFFGLVVIIDIEHRLIMNIVSLAGAVLGLVTGTIRYDVITSLLGGLAGLAIMLLFYWLGMQFARYRARKLGTDDGEEALGFGDVSLTTVLGLMLGWPYILFGLFFGILAGGLVSLVLILFLMVTRRYQSMTVFTAYGPYLVLGAAILLYSPKILSIMLGR
jgi:leader peptidase (prepilin peptidase) / N-methyltransferase